jgi:hypothetical protein
MAFKTTMLRLREDLQENSKKTSKKTQAPHTGRRNLGGPRFSSGKTGNTGSRTRISDAQLVCGRTSCRPKGKEQAPASR